MPATRRSATPRTALRPRRKAASSKQPVTEPCEHGADVLPPEVLAVVASLVVLPADLLTLRQVSRQWRDVARDAKVVNAVLQRQPQYHCLRSFTPRQALCLYARAQGLVDTARPIRSYRAEACKLAEELLCGAGSKGSIPVRHYRTLCALALAHWCHSHDAVLMRDLGHGEGSTWGCKSVQEFLRSEWTFFLVEEQPSAFSEHLRPVRHILSDEYFHVAQYIALTQMNVDAKDAAVIADFFNHLDEQLWELTGGGGGGLSEDSEEMALHADSGAIGAIATTLERFCFEPFVLQNALRCLADLCLGHAPQLPPMTRAGRAKYAVNSARLAARREAAAAAVEPALAAAACPPSGLGAEGSVRGVAMLFIMYWVETDDVHAPPVVVDETHCARASVGIYSPERVERLAELGGVDVAVKCLLRGLEEEESDGTLLVDEANFEHVSPAAVVLHALVDSSPARRAEAIRLGALPALVALMRARMAAESEDGVPLGPSPLGLLHFMVKDDPEAYIAATDAGARAEWLAEPPAPPTPLAQGWGGIVYVEDFVRVPYPFDED